jgi:hypothetical protein
MEGNFFEPTILGDVPKNAAVAKEETFGPLAPLFRFKDEAEVIAHGQRHRVRSGLVLLCQDLGRVFRVAEALEYGMVGVNTGLISNEVAPFGGVKAVGSGPRRLQVRHRRLPGNQIPLPGHLSPARRCFKRKGHESAVPLRRLKPEFSLRPGTPWQSIIACCHRRFLPLNP